MSANNQWPRRELLGATAITIISSIAGCVGSDAPSGDDYDYDVDEVREEAERVDFSELMRNADEYQDEYLYYRGDVIQVMSDDDNEEFQFRMNVNEDGDDIFCVWEGERIIENDWLEIYGIGAGWIEYESVAGNEREIPAIYVADLDIVDEYPD